MVKMVNPMLRIFCHNLFKKEYVETSWLVGSLFSARQLLDPGGGGLYVHICMFIYV